MAYRALGHSRRAGGSVLSFAYALAPGASFEAIGAILARLLTQYRSTGYAHGFRLQQTDRIYHIVPWDAARATGGEEAYQAVLSLVMFLSFSAEGDVPHMKPLRILFRPFSRQPASRR